MSSFRAVLDAHFPNASPTADYVAWALTALAPHGFRPTNTLACVGTCRDEDARPLRDALQSAWGEAFNFSGLGGVLSLGRTGFGAACAHAPIEGGRGRMLFVGMPHVAIDDAGVVGHVVRIGLPDTSTACGALIAFREAFIAGTCRRDLDPLDLEQCLIEGSLSAALAGVAAPDLATVTHAARAFIAEELREMIARSVDPATMDWAVLTGVQIHGPRQDWVAPAESYVSVSGVEATLDTTRETPALV